MPDKFLVTGGAGFLGSHLCEVLLSSGAEVTCLDNFYTGSPRNIQHLVTRGLSVIEGDVTDKLPVADWTGIYNLACPASPIHYQYDSLGTTKTCVLGALNVIDLALETDARVMHVSTSEVYGDPLEHPQSETYWGNVNPIGVRSCYDEGKRCAETLLFDAVRQHNLSLGIARVFNTYGPNMHPQDGRVVSNFIIQCLKGVPLTVFGEGAQTRSFCYVDDLINGFVSLMNFSGQYDEDDVVFNLGNPREFTIAELAKIIQNLTKSSSELIHQPLPSDDPRQRKPVIDKARQKLGWEPRVQLAQGLEFTIAYFSNLLESNDERLTSKYGSKANQ